ncbi:NACHT domain-containing protein [Streptomyces sp. NPDC001027]|uniref:NACHT domain-containing protein n=1 Tax=Streptomyces sp. NPDC001027 TaxID=3154771 RepID=UPI003316972F
MSGKTTRQLWWALLGIAVVLLGSSLVWGVDTLFTRSLQPQDTASVLGLFIGVAGVVLSMLALRRPTETDPAILAGRLAARVRNTEGEQWRRLLGGDRVPINITFTFQTGGRRAAVPPQRPAGSLDGVADDFMATRPRRLVITGEPGAGKTVLAVKLILALLARRGSDDPVPVRFPLSDWDVTVPLERWLSERLEHDFDLAAAEAQCLVEHRLVLPVMDGLDEMDPPDTDRPERATTALRLLAAYQDGTDPSPFVLTCRSAFYEQATAHGSPAADTARVHLGPVSADQARAFLEDRSNQPERWNHVLRVLADRPTGPLAHALSTPWRLTLATTAYAHDGDPGELLNHDSPTAIDRHLLARYVPALTALLPDPHYPAERVEQWLFILARHLGRHGETRIVPYRLWPLAGRLRVLALDLLLVVVCIVPAVQTLRDYSWFALAFAGPMSLLDDVWLAIGVGAIFWAFRLGSPIPAVARWPRRGTHARLDLARRRRTRGVAVGGALGAATAIFITVQPLQWGFPSVYLAFPYTEVMGVMLSSYAVLAGLVVAVTTGAIAAVTTEPSREADNSALDLGHPLRGDLVAGLAKAISYGAALALLVSLFKVSEVLGDYLYWADLLDEPVSTEYTDYTAGVSSGMALTLLIAAVCLRATRRYVAFVVCLRGLPRRLGRFLSWACEAGLLRTSGDAYQFRHLQLQQWLDSRAPDGAPRTRTPNVHS